MTLSVSAIAAAGAVAGALVVGPLAAIGGAWYGKGLGSQLQAGDEAKRAVGELTKLIGATTALTQRATAASAAMRQALTERQQYDSTTTQEIRDALAPTAAARLDCNFGPDVMRQLAAARERAARAAAGGIRDPVSGPGGDPAGQP